MRVLMTGATGQVGGFLRPYLRERYDEVVLSSRSEVEDLQPGETFRRADLSDRAALEAAVTDVDGIIHLGGMPVEGDWETVLAANIVGMYDLYEASRRAGVKRIVFASSVHAIGFWPSHRRIDAENRTRPDTRYGLSKVFGEGLSSLYADKFGLRTLAIRIGSCTLEPINLRHLPIWLHPEDLWQLCEIGLEHPEVHNQVVFGASNNSRSFWDNGAAFRLGYRPKHRGEDFSVEELAARTDPDPVADRFQGNVFTSEDFDGDLERALWS